MEKLCPICNSISTIVVYCDCCNKEMIECGREQEFRDAYGGEDEVEFVNNCCRHIFFCSRCGIIKEADIEDVYI